MVTKDTLWLGKKPIRILYSKNVAVRGNKFIGEDIISEPVEIIKSEDVKIGNYTFNSKKMTGKDLE